VSEDNSKGFQKHGHRRALSYNNSECLSSRSNRSCRWESGSQRESRSSILDGPPPPPSPSTSSRKRSDKNESTSPSKPENRHRWNELHKQVSSPILPSRKKFQFSPPSPAGRGASSLSQQLPPALRVLPY
jgi:hypothetical protein